ncbi:thiolase family protein [Roseibium sp.]|uniref:thiolase family protein n=1 Tax=Roseibium sp. TaxID=1936156 RepID=UPI003A97BBB7
MRSSGNVPAKAVITAARRTAVVPRGGAFRLLQADELAAPVITAVLADAGVRKEDVDHVIFGNALYGGGNPARMAALRAGLPAHVPAMTIDTQCCSGLDAILLAVRMVEAGAADCIVAGGMESFSRSPIRQHRPVDKGGAAVPYDRPAFAPDPAMDPDLSEAAARLAERRGISRETQADFACLSHLKALDAYEAGAYARELVTITAAPVPFDPFARRLTRSVAMRAPVLAGIADSGINAATAAVEADAAAAVVVMSKDRATGMARAGQRRARVSVCAGVSVGDAPDEPALAPVAAIDSLLKQCGLAIADLARIELMEAYASQALATCDALDIPADVLNREGGALSRGHPIGASGAVLAVRLFHGLTQETPSSRSALTGLAAIPAAGGLASAMALCFDD